MTFNSVPTGWSVRPLWSMFAREKNVGHPEETMLSVFREHGVVEKDSRNNLNVTADNRNIYQLVDEGWLVVNRMKAWQGSVGISSYRGIVSGHYLCFRPVHAESSRYLNWLLRSAPYIAAYRGLSRGVRPGQAEIDNDQLRVLGILVPPLQEQRRIADFLDDQVVLLDRVITLRHQEAALLREREESFVDETVRMLIQDHPLIPVKYMTSEVDERLGTGEPPPLLSVSIHRGVIRRSEITDQEPSANDLAGYKVCAPGDIVLNRMRAFQGGIGVARTNGVVSPDYAVLRPLVGVLPEWLNLLFRSGWFVSEMTRRLRGLGGIDQGAVRTPRINVADLGLIKVPNLKMADQSQLIDALTGVHSWRGEIASLGSRQADLLSERKGALITAAVMGHLDATTARSVA